MIGFRRGEVKKGTRPAVRCGDCWKPIVGPAFTLSVSETVFALHVECAESLYADMGSILGKKS